MTIRMTRRRVLKGAALLAGGTALPGLGGRATAQATETHGLSTFGELGLPADFPHFPYVNRRRPRAAR